MMGRVFVLLLLIAVLAAGGLVWLDYLNIIDAKVVISPLTRHIGMQPRSQPRTGPDELLNLDAERLAIRLEALDLQKLEVDTRNRDLDSRQGLIEQMAQELEARQQQLDDMANSLRGRQEDAENRDRNIEQNARLLNGMPPERAVGIMSAMDDQDVIDVLRKTEEIAQAAGTTSIVSYWLSLMEPARAAELQRKMAGRPQTL
ncbi:MAG: flagellar protein FlbB [Treponema sp.]|jgi:flagellar protein FlbB|nr:flagellar protein FlbB [Treponema sp.]